MQTLESQIRLPSVAGLFYPDDATRLKFQLNRLFEEAERVGVAKGFRPRAIVSPHAGYIYSGAIAANAFSSALSRREEIERVVVLGPSHHIAFEGAACPSAKQFSTPLGLIEVDTHEIDRLQAQGLVNINDAAHVREHSIEVQLPFLQQFLSHFLLLPIVVGQCDVRSVAKILENYWDSDNALIVVSSDLSHYLDYYDARNIDRDTTNSIEACRWRDIGPYQACGCYPLRGLLELGLEKHCKATCIDLRNSGDTAGDKSRVVGYGAYVFE